MEEDKITNIRYQRVYSIQRNRIVFEECSKGDYLHIMYFDLNNPLESQQFHLFKNAPPQTLFKLFFGDSGFLLAEVANPVTEFDKSVEKLYHDAGMQDEHNNLPVITLKGVKENLTENDFKSVSRRYLEADIPDAALALEPRFLPKKERPERVKKKKYPLTINIPVKQLKQKNALLGKALGTLEKLADEDNNTFFYSPGQLERNALIAEIKQHLANGNTR